MLEVLPSEHRIGLQRFHLTVAPASGAQIGPGATLRNYAITGGRLGAEGAAVIHVCHIVGRSHSELTLRCACTRPQAPRSTSSCAMERVKQIDCMCGSSGNESLQRAVRPRESLGVLLHLSPHARAPAGVEAQRYNPVLGWQLYRELHARIGGGRAGVPLPVPAIGRYRAKATFNGTRVFSPSRIGYTYLNVS